MEKLRFPLPDKIRRAGGFSGKSLLITAPTATGKSKVGIDLLFHYLQSKPPGFTNTYLVPYRALARELFSSILERGKMEAPEAVIKLATGDYSDPELDLKKTDILVATYEKCDSLLRDEPKFCPYLVVADEIHHLGDSSRGARIEGLITKLMTSERRPLFFPLSATVGNPKDLAKWMDIDLLLGTEKDRVVQLTFDRVFTADKNHVIEENVLKTISENGQVLVFCNTRKRAENQATDLSKQVEQTLSPDVRTGLSELAKKIGECAGASDRMIRLISQGVSYHHAGLDSDLRALIEQGYRERYLKVIVCTPTLAGGVNLPARLVVIKDAYRISYFRGRAKKAFLRKGELLQMLGRAGRPGLDTEGKGLVLFDTQDKEKPEAELLWQGIEAKITEEVESQIEKRFNYLMEFLLGGINSRGPCSVETLVGMIKKTFWYFQKKPRLDDEGSNLVHTVIDSWEAMDRVTDAFHLDQLVIVGGGISARVRNDYGGDYKLQLVSTHFSCDCPAFHFTPGHLEPCKHIAFLFRELLLGSPSEDPLIGNVAVQVFLDLFGAKVGVIAKVKEALKVLKRWQFIREKQREFSISKPGKVALASYLDLSLAHEISLRILHDRGSADFAQVLKWAVRDIVGVEESGEDWIEILKRWMEEAPREDIEKEVGYFPDFLAFREQVGWVLFTYYRFAKLYKKDKLLDEIKLLIRRLNHGVKEDLLYLAIFNFPDIARGRLRYLAQKNLNNLWDLAASDRQELAKRNILPLQIAGRTVSIAKEKLFSIEGVVKGFSKNELKDRKNDISIEISRKIYVPAEDINDLVFPEILKRYGRRLEVRG
jgi:replicative superfamily II helicase